jgi:hypothetical protein
VFAWRAYPPAAGASDGAYLTAPSLSRRGVRVAFTTRHGGVSREPFTSLNLSYISGDDPAWVRANRARALGVLGLGLSAWTSGRQVHGSHVVRVGPSERGAGADSPADTIPGADALWTQDPGIALAVLTADCVPLVLADPDRMLLGVVHVGWRGLVGGVVERALADIGTGGSMVALAGPSIGPCCYEVGEDVAGPARERFGEEVLRGRNLDLWAGVAGALRAGGARQVHFAALCTRCEPARFYSHRRGDAARQGVVACLR